MFRYAVPLPVPDRREARFGRQDGDPQADLVGREGWFQAVRQALGAIVIGVVARTGTAVAVARLPYSRGGWMIQMFGSQYSPRSWSRSMWTVVRPAGKT